MTDSVSGYASWKWSISDTTATYVALVRRVNSSQEDRWHKDRVAWDTYESDLKSQYSVGSPSAPPQSWAFCPSLSYFSLADTLLKASGMRYMDLQSVLFMAPLEPLEMFDANAPVDPEAPVMIAEIHSHFAQARRGNGL